MLKKEGGWGQFGGKSCWEFEKERGDGVGSSFHDNLAGVVCNNGSKTFM